MLTVIALSIFIPVQQASFPINTVTMFAVFAVLFAVLAALALAGGISSLRRKRWGLVLAGAIAAFLPFSFLGLAALVLIVMSRKEFESA